MIIRQACPMMLEGVEASGGDDPSLSHASSQAFAGQVDALDDFCRAAYYGANRRTEAFGAAKSHCIEALRPAIGGNSGRRYGVEQPSAVQVGGEASLLRDVDGFFHRFQGKHLASITGLTNSPSRIEGSN